MRMYTIFVLHISMTHLRSRMPPDRGLADKKSSGVKGKKVRLTYAFTSNADGSEKLPPIIIGKAKKPRAFRNKTGVQLGFYYRNNAKAWMTSVLYQEWLRQWDQELGKKKRKVLLLQDNFSGHIIPEDLQNIRVENFTPNLTAHIQPMDQGIIRCFKAHYRARYIQRAINRYDADVTPSEIYDINQLQAMRLADVAWQEVDVTTIRHCWRKASILPSTDFSTPVQPTIQVSSLLNTDIDATPCHEDPIINAENQLKHALDDLVSTGALQTQNRMDIESLLNPANEVPFTNETTDEEIFQAVMEAQKAHEEGLINGGDDDIEDNASVEARPSHRDVLHAVSTIGNYIESINDPVARQLEGILASFGRQIRLEASRSLVPTYLRDYFSHK